MPATEFFDTLAFENHPIPADVPYATRVEDITGRNRGWLEKVEAVLFSAASAPVADVHAAVR